jgi:hypothetical protein
MIAPWLTGYSIQSTGQFTNAFAVAAAVSMLGLVGWILMVPKLKELEWKHAAPPAGVVAPESG